MSAFTLKFEVYDWFAVSWRTKSANVVVQQHSRKLLKMGILMPETC